MNQEDFFESFQDALAGEVSESVIQENIRYYKSYIYEQSQKGQTVEDILNSLGNPRLLAKTIISANSPNRDYRDSYTEYDSSRASSDHRSFKQKIQELTIPVWLRKVLSILVVVGVIVLAFAVISYLAPFILFIACIFIVVRIIRNISDGS